MVVSMHDLDLPWALPIVLCEWCTGHAAPEDRYRCTPVTASRDAPCITVTGVCCTFGMQSEA